jgi:hypothetical protein
MELSGSICYMSQFILLCKRMPACSGDTRTVAINPNKGKMCITVRKLVVQTRWIIVTTGNIAFPDDLKGGDKCPEQ